MGAATRIALLANTRTTTLSIQHLLHCPFASAALIATVAFAAPATTLTTTTLTASLTTTLTANLIGFTTGATQVPRHEKLVRLTGRHPFNVEPPLPELWR